jgi:ADP-heptose:LPS heptosyltransferase
MFQMHRMTPQRILFITEGGLGDHVALTPALRELKRSFPESFVCVFTTYRRPTDNTKPNPFDNLYPSQIEKDNSILATDANIDEMYVLDRYAFKSLRGITRVKAELAVLRFLRRKNFDTVICTFPHKDRFILWSYGSGARVRVGARNQGLRWLLTHTPDIEKSRGGVVEYYCDLVRAIGATIRSTRTEYVVPETSLQWADRVLDGMRLDRAKKLVAIHPGASGSYKVWPTDRVAALIDHVSSHLDASVVLLKGAMDEEIVASIRGHLRSNVPEIDCGNRVGDLGALLKRCSLCISNDSGPRHLAVAVGAPSLAFYRFHHDKEWDVYQEVDSCITLKGSGVCPACPPEKCFDRVPEGEQFGSHCLRMIRLEDAIREVERMLMRPPAETEH